MALYQEVYPSAPLVRSDDVARPRAAALLSLEYFEAEPASMPTQAFDQHHVLINLRAEPHRVENWRGGVHRDFILRRNEIIVTPAGLESGWRWHARSRVIVITLAPRQLEAFTERELGVILTDQQLRDLPQFEDADITGAAEMLLAALRAPGPGSDVMFESLARVFLVKLVQKYGDQRSDAIAFSRAFTSAQYRRVLDHVEASYAGPIAVEDLAREAGLSPSHFTRVFKQVIGVTPHQFVMRYRVDRAQAALSDADQPLADVALACGFGDQAHFSRVYKQIAGETPRQARRRLSARAE